MRNMGLARFAVLYPRDDYGKEMAELFREEVLKSGGQIKAMKSYDKAKADFEEEIVALKNPEPAHAENDRNGLNTQDSAPGFDALFIPDSSLRVSMIVPQLAFHDVTGIRLLGTGAWNSPALLKEDVDYLEGAVFTDDFYRGSFYPEVNDFVDAFYAAYGREPEGLEALVYDAANIAANLIAGKGRETRERLRDALSEFRDFPGVTGRTSASANRGVGKDSFLLTIRNGQIMQIRQE
jgi:branched-chain amino acid transport system substrate-binding protein